MKLLGPGIESAIDAEKDMFNRDAFARRLLTLFRESLDPLVVSLDENWGTGKTVFARRLEKQAAENFTVVYFDAFANDFASDVFVSFVSEVMGKFPIQEKRRRSLKQSAKAVAKAGGRVLAKGAVRFGTAGLLDGAELEGIANHAATAVAEIAQKELDQIIDLRLEEARKDKDIVEKFRFELQRLTVADSDCRRPILFIVDELDRCRPDYALTVLETIKHFFSVDSVHFLLLCQMDLLSASIRQRYGSEVDAQKYLEKFIHLHVSFPTADEDRRKRQLTQYISGIFEAFPDDGEEGQWAGNMAEFVVNISVKRNYSLRRIERILAQFSVCLKFTSKKQLRLGAIIYVLCDLKISAPELFKKAKSGQLTFSEIKDHYSFDGDEDEHWYLEWLEYFYDSTVNTSDSRWNDFNIFLRGYAITNPRRTAMLLANEIVDCISISG
ncbi:KAP family P-loop NTPase fold protein [Rhizobium sp. PAMB 3174]